MWFSYIQYYSKVQEDLDTKFGLGLYCNCAYVQLVIFLSYRRVILELREKVVRWLFFPVIRQLHDYNWVVRINITMNF